MMSLKYLVAPEVAAGEFVPLFRLAIDSMCLVSILRKAFSKHSR